MKRPVIAAFVATIVILTSSLAQAQQPSGDPNQQPQPAAVQPAASAPQDQAPEHISTGWSALFKDTVRDFAQFPRRPSTWVILGIGVGGALLTHPADSYVETHVVNNKNADRIFSVGKWVGSDYAMVASSVGLWAVGRYVVGPVAEESMTNKYSEMGFDLMRSQILAQTMVQATKYALRRHRPTGECCSFPSGHAASAFAAAAVLERHLGYRGSWPFIAGAFYVGASRLVDNRHFLSDVMMGAAIGTASGWTVVGHHPSNSFVLRPVAVDGGMMIALVKQPNAAARPRGGSHE